jgi:WD40 repeat protein/serine/threonine protein kinase/DNA-binding XRE family transcriptional regulator
MDQDVTFGAVVKELRSALGLTQTELARRVGCAAITIRKIEADALRPSVQMAELIAVALNVPEEEQLAFVRLARAASRTSPIPSPSPQPGEIGLTDLSGRAVKGFQLGEKIGSGGYGVVYRAIQPSVERDVAVKIILPRYANHPNFIRRFEAEAQLIARLEHPHIVPLYDYWREPDAAYLIMRLLRGGSLEEQLNEGPIPIKLIHQYIQQIGLALDVAHRNGVIHRDIKPANVLLDEETNAYLADFGIAKNLEGINGKSLTEGGSLIGSPAYISPEQILAEPVKPQSDIYCLGILLFEMLTGRKPFSGLTPIAFIQQHLNDSLPPLQTFDTQLPLELDEVIRLATAKNIADRYRDVPSLLRAVQQAFSVMDDSSGEPMYGEISVELTTAELANLENPYKGLRAFTEADAEHFHGRSTLIQELFARLSEQTELDRFLAIVGPSGSGKSSVAKAGLVPALRRGGLPDSENWFVLDLTPGAHPWEEVEAALLQVAVNPPETLLNQLQEGDRGLLRAVRRILPDDGQTELVLIIDQFEELFTLVEDEALREQFLNSLVTAVLDERSRLRVVITLRADFYDRPLQYVDFGDLMRQRTVSVLPMTPDELEQAITQPAAQVSVWLEEGLAAAIIRDVGNQPGTLPLLQYVLTELFEERNKNVMTRAAYEAAGGVSAALARRADEIYEGLATDARDAARQLFLQLITLGEGVEDTRRRVRISALPRDITEEVIKEFGRYRLLTFDHDPITREPTVEVAHEAILREWERLRQWLNDSRDDIRQERALARAAEEWDQHQQDVSFLLRGKRLEQIEIWQETTTIMLTLLEQGFMAQSLEQRAQEKQAELARKEREARLEQRSRNFLRGLVAVFALAAIISAVLGLFAFQQRQGALDSAAEAQNVALVAGSQAALANDDTDAALALAWQAITLNPDSALAQAQLSDVAYTPGTVRRFIGNNDDVLAVDISPDGRTALSGSKDRTVRHWDFETGEILWQGEEHENSVSDVDISPDGQIAASVSDDATILWDVSTGQIIRKLDGHEENISSVAFGPDGKRMVTAGWGDESFVILWDVASGEIIDRFPSKSRVEGITFTPDGSSVLYAGFDDGTLTMIDSETGEIIHEMNAGLGISAGGLDSVDVSSDGLTAITGFENSDVLLWDLLTGELLEHYEVSGGARTVALHPENNTALVGGTTSVITNLDLQSGRIINSFNGHTADVFEIVISDDGKKAVSGSLDHSLRLWELDRGHVIRHVAEPSSLTFETDLSPDGRTAIRGSTDGSATLFDVETGEVIHQLIDDQPVMAVTFSPDGQTALIGAGYRFAQKVESGHIILWDVATGEEIRRFEGQPYVVFDVEFSPDGNRAVSSGNGAIVILWDVETGQEIRRFEDYFVDSEWPGESYWDVEFSPDGRSILASFAKGPLIQWDAETGEQIKQLVGHVNTGAPGVTFNKDGQRAVSGGFDAQAILWDMEKGDVMRRFTNHAGSLGQVQFSPDDKLLLGSSSDGTSSLWDVETGDVLRRYGNGWIMKFIFSEDGRQALAGYRNGALELWRMDTTLDDLLSWTEANRYIPELTCNQRALYNIEPLCEAEE